MINIKIAKAYRTISFEASCGMAGILPIELVTEEKASRHNKAQPRIRRTTASLGMATSHSNTAGRQSWNSRIGLTWQMRPKLQKPKDVSDEQY